MPVAPHRPWTRAAAGAVAAVVVVAGGACSSGDAATDGGGASRPAGSTSEVAGALQGLPALDGEPEGRARARLLAAAADAVDEAPRARDPLEIETPEDAFVEDAQRAWTLALAARVTGRERERAAAVAVVDDWVTTTRSLDNACPDSGACDTSLMVSRAAPALVFAVDVLRAEGAYDEHRTRRFRTWLREVILPGASDRTNNWGDAGTYLRAVIAVELDDEELMDDAARRWRERIDLIGPDGQIPEEVRRGDAGLMYSQEALDYKVATADVLARAGIDLWDVEGERGGTLRSALDLVASAIEDPERWPEPVDDLRVPTPSGLWPIAAARWPDAPFAELAAEAARDDGDGHSAITWTAITHAVPSTTNASAADRPVTSDRRRSPHPTGGRRRRPIEGGSFPSHRTGGLS